MLRSKYNSLLEHVSQQTFSTSSYSETWETIALHPEKVTSKSQLKPKPYIALKIAVASASLLSQLLVVVYIIVGLNVGTQEVGNFVGVENDGRLVGNSVSQVRKSF